MKTLQIFIEANEIELPQDITVPVVYQIEDLTNPTSKKVGYSKTITIEGTPFNNDIFGSIWDVRRSTIVVGGSFNEGCYFNPSKRATCSIYVDGDMAFSGYCKLDNVNIDGEKVTYSITIFADLADFFYNLAYSENGDAKTLADLDYGYNLDFDITTTTIRKAWDGLANWGINSKWDIINFNPNCYDGLPDDFSTDVALVKAYGTMFPTTAGQYSTYNGYGLAKLENDYTGLEMRDLRSYLIRPVLSVRGFFQGISDFNSNGGYEVVLDKGFFNSDNPYYGDAWITLPTLSELDMSTEDEYEGHTNSGSQRVASYNLRFVGDLSGTTVNLSDFPYGTTSLELNFKLLHISSTANPATSFYTYWDKIEKYPLEGHYDDYEAIWIWDTWSTVVSLGDSTSFVVKVDIMDGNGNIIKTETRRYGNGSNGIGGKFEYLSGTTWTFRDGSGSDTFQIKINDVPKTEQYVARVSLTFPTLYTSNKGEIVYDTGSEGEFYVRSENLPAEYKNTCYFRDMGSYLKFLPASIINTGSRVTKDKLLGGLGSPLDYLLSYCKMFGLYLVKDAYDKRITIMPRNKFFTGEIEDISGRIDYSKGIDITPLNFDAKWYTFKNECVEDTYEKKYKKDYKADYGEQKVDTNYNFDSEEKNLCENNVFKTAPMARGKSRYYRVFHTTGGSDVPSFTADGFEWTLFKNGSDYEDTSGSTKALNGGTYTNYYSKQGGYDVNAKLSLMSGDREAEAGDSILVFFNGFKIPRDNEGREIVYFITDDNDEMYILNEQSPCWLHTQSNISKGTYTEGMEDYYAYQYKRHIDNILSACLPEFSRYKVADGNITYSLDYGEPKELYVDDITSTSATTVYHKFWKRFIDDQLNIDSRVFSCYVKFDYLKESDLRKIYFFEDSMWLLNKVTDYDLAGDGVTKCEFVKIIDTNAYTKGQILSDEEVTLRVTYMGYAISTLTIPMTGFKDTLYILANNIEDLRIESAPEWFIYKLDGVSLRCSVAQRLQARSGEVVIKGNNIFDGSTIEFRLNVLQSGTAPNA